MGGCITSLQAPSPIALGGLMVLSYTTVELLGAGSTGTMLLWETILPLKPVT